MTLPIKRPRATGRVTLSDVAQLAGVSPITVSRALRRERAVQPELIERVELAARKLGYVPDPAARALASQRSSHVAVLIPLLSNALFVELLEAVQSVLRPADYQSLIGITHYDPAQEEQLLRELLQHRPAGLLVTGFDHTEATQALIQSSGIPCVHMMETSNIAGSHSVGLSQTAAAIAMTEYLIKKGYKRIAFGASQLDPRALQRLAGWRQAMESAGLYDARLEWRNPTPSSMQLGGVMFEQIIAQSPRVDALFFCNDDLAQGALMSALRLGIEVPSQIAIAGFNDLTGSDQMLPTLTTIRTPRGLIGETAAKMLLGLMRGTSPALQSVDLGFEVVERGST
jgi:LacI family transcriptional regulator, gluconate utilization system Gnt-I transcriptional repressor